jgi:hypothetical protein
MTDVILFFAYALGKLLSELRFLGWGDDKIGRFAGGLAVRFIKGKAVCKTEFITQFQVGVRNTWNNAEMGG